MFLPAIETVRMINASDMTVSPVQNQSEIEMAIAAAAGRPASGLIFLSDSFLASHRDFVVGTAIRAIYRPCRVPLCRKRSTLSSSSTRCGRCDSAVMPLAVRFLGLDVKPLAHDFLAHDA